MRCRLASEVSDRRWGAYMAEWDRLPADRGAGADRQGGLSVTDDRQDPSGVAGGDTAMSSMVDRMSSVVYISKDPGHHRPMRSATLPQFGPSNHPNARTYPPPWSPRPSEDSLHDALRRTPTCPKCGTAAHSSVRIFTTRTRHEAIYLLTAYAKADREDLNPADRKVLSRLVAAIKKEERNP